jgi:hypothetical protein
LAIARIRRIAAHSGQLARTLETAGVDVVRFLDVALTASAIS